MYHFEKLKIDQLWVFPLTLPRRPQRDAYGTGQAGGELKEADGDYCDDTQILNKI